MMARQHDATQLIYVLSDELATSATDVDATQIRDVRHAVETRISRDCWKYSPDRRRTSRHGCAEYGMRTRSAHGFAAAAV